MQFNNTIIEDELALALYNTRFVSDQLYNSHANNRITSNSCWDTTQTNQQSLVSVSSIESTTLPMVSFSKFDLNQIALQSFFNKFNDHNDEHDDELLIYKHINLDKENSILYLPENMSVQLLYLNYVTAH